MMNRTLVLLLVGILIAYLVYYFFFRKTRDDTKTYEYYKNIVSNLAIPRLNVNDFSNINNQLNRDALDLMVFTKLKKRRSSLYSSLGLRMALLPCFLGSTINSGIWNMYDKIYSGISEKRLLSFHRDLNKYLISTGKINIANSIWYDSNLQLNSKYKQLVSCIAEHKTPLVQQDIDDWVSVRTNGMINNIEIPTLTDIVVLNVIYFKDKWSVPFPKSKSKIDRFVSWDGHESEVKYMTTTDTFMYSEDGTAQAIRLDYKSPFSMLIILPQNGNEPVPISHNNVKKLLSLMTEQEVEVTIPKFEYEDTHSLIEPMIEAGYTQIKDSTYDRLIENQMPVEIIQIIQKNKIRVDEDGTEAASATAVCNQLQMALPSKTHIVFKADHSFLFYIIHRPTLELLFSGIFNSF